MIGAMGRVSVSTRLGECTKGSGATISAMGKALRCLARGVSTWVSMWMGDCRAEAFTHGLMETVTVEIC